MTPLHPSSPALEPIRVVIDRDLEDLIPIFLANRKKDMETLRNALHDKDFDTIRMLGHRMKGDGGGYGFQAISEMGRVMELAAGRRDLPACEQTVAQLDDFLARVTITYR